ncbi:MAG: multicopper oxidase domain-containing protein [Nocardioidaceae bacterium]
MALSRRDAVKLGVLGTAGVVLPIEQVAHTKLAFRRRLRADDLPRPFTAGFVVPPVLSPGASKEVDGQMTDFYQVTMRAAKVEIVPGLKTEIWGYNGILPGPTISSRRKRPTVIRQINSLPARHPRLRYQPTTSLHLHGSASLPQYDGYASDVSEPGQYKDYKFPQIQEARTDWYHDHGVHHTAPNVAMGLAGQYHMHDEHEESLPLPKGRYDVPITLFDASFAADGSLLYDDHSESGNYGNVITANGKAWPVMRVEPRKYRFRILNACVSRSYRLSLSTGEPLTVIGTDAGLMPKPQQVKSLRQGMAERYEVVIDFSGYKAGQRVVLRNSSPDNNIDYEHTNKVMAFDVVLPLDTSKPDPDLPDELNPDCEVMKLTEKDAKRTRRFDFERKNGLWTINGKTWADVVNSDYEFVSANPGLGDTEIWELRNTHGGWFHPVHIHLVDSRILSRNGRPPFAYEQGPKDVFYVGENETVRVIATFGPHAGKYMMHCHNLVHEDHDMMVQFQVGSGGPDPIKSDPARAVSAMPRLGS